MSLTRWLALATVPFPSLAPPAGIPSPSTSAWLARAVDDIAVVRSFEFPLGNRTGARGGALAPVAVRRGVLFRCRAPDASTVSVIGEFNGWDETANRMRRTADGIWRGTVDLDPGSWRYLFSVDGEWILDPDNPISREGPSEEYAETSMLVVKRGEVVTPRARGQQEVSAHLSGNYQRVDAVTLWGGLSYASLTELHPRLDLAAGYSFGRERGLYGVGAVQPLFDVHLLDVGALLYRYTDTPDSFRFGNVENTLATLFVAQDWRDFGEAEGLTAHATIYLGSRADLTLRWRGEENRALEKTTDRGLFGGDMRDNPAFDDGTLRTLALHLHWDSRNDRESPTRGTLFHAKRVWAGNDLGGDFHYTQSFLHYRRYARLSQGHWFDFRVMTGSIDDASRGAGDDRVTGFEAIPFQNAFFVGGLGTMRATRYKSISGDRMFLVNGEVRVEIFRDFQAVVFADVGDAWISEDDRMDLNVDAGIGFQDADASFRINFARKMDRDDGSIHITSRIQRMF